ncbi:MAG: hypothetical protein HZB53_10910 [Chloroflexi bacterium]|nr:hypothetical protein [Chloroflexota bacterium]
MHMNIRSIKVWALLAILALGAGALAPRPAQADGGTCPAPGTGYAGARNMIADATMGSIPMARDNINGNIGMHTAVVNSSCP